VSGTVVEFPRRQAQERRLTYSELSRELGVSVRFLRYRYREGMPSEGLDYVGRRVFLPSRCREWLDRRQRRMGRTV
jgi:hypothetical protein